MAIGDDPECDIATVEFPSDLRRDRDGDSPQIQTIYLLSRAGALRFVKLLPVRPGPLSPAYHAHFEPFFL